MSGAVMAACVKQFVAADEPAVAGDHVVKEHRQRHPAELRQGHDLEFDLDPQQVGELMAQSVKLGPQAIFKEPGIPMDEEVKFQVVVRLFASVRLQHAAFAAAITAAEEQSLN